MWARGGTSMLWMGRDRSTESRLQLAQGAGLSVLQQIVSSSAAVRLQRRVSGEEEVRPVVVLVGLSSSLASTAERADPVFPCFRESAVEWQQGRLALF